MAQSGYTPILTYGSTTPSSTPLAANLTTSSSGVELAVNAADGKLFYKDSGGTVQVLATKGTGPIGGSNTQIQFNNNGALGGSSSLTWDGTYLTAGSIKDSALTSGRVTYAGASGLLQDSSNLTFDGTTLTANALTLTNKLTIANGGTNATATPTAGAVAYGTGTAYAFTAAGTTNQVLVSNGASAPSWSSLSSIGVTTFSAGTTGFTPSSATSGAITLAGTLATTNGGTGLTSFTANGVVYASSTSALTTGSALTFSGTTLTLNGTTSSQSIIKLVAASGSAGGFKRTIINFRDDTGTAGYDIVGLGDGSNALTFDSVSGGTGTTRMLLDSSGNLGIGTSSPSSYGSRLVVQSNGVTDGIVVGDLATPANNTSLYLRSTGLSKIYTAVGGAITFGANGGNEYGRFDASGNLGLGVTPSAWGAGYAPIQSSYGILSGNNQATILSNAYFNAGYKYINSSFAAQYLVTASGQHQWFTAPSGTAGNAISFTQAMTLDSSGQLGIGVTSPGVPLDIYRGAGGSLIRLSSSSSATAQNGIYFKSTGASYANNFYLYNGNLVGGGFGFALYDDTTATTRLAVDNSGNLGLGVVPSAWGSAWRGFQVGTSGALWSTASGVAGVYMSQNNYFNGSNRIYSGTGPALEFSMASGQFGWSIAGSGTGGTAVSFTQAMTLDPSGNLGLNVTPSAWVSPFKAIEGGGSGAYAAIGFQSNANCIKLFSNAYYNGSYIYKNSIGATMVSVQEGAFQVFNAPSGTAGAAITWTQALTLDSSGNLLVGTTSAGWSYPGSVNAVGYACRSGQSGTFSGNGFNINWTGNPILWIDSTNVGQIATTSDYRLKENVATQDAPALERVMRLNPIKFNRKEIGIFSGSDAVEEGFLAHELQEIIPSAVHGEKDALTEEGGIQPQSLNWAPIVSVLVKAIQELKAEIDALKAAK